MLLLIIISSACNFYSIENSVGRQFFKWVVMIEFGQDVNPSSLPYYLLDIILEKRLDYPKLELVVSAIYLFVSI